LCKNITASALEKLKVGLPLKTKVERGKSMRECYENVIGKEGKSHVQYKKAMGKSK